MSRQQFTVKLNGSVDSNASISKRQNYETLKKEFQSKIIKEIPLLQITYNDNGTITITADDSISKIKSVICKLQLIPQITIIQNHTKNNVDSIKLKKQDIE
tara:strand:+ start:659 stop:961 length:303 start_codon:yes stop_codon:yes gene_type:complete